jgi:SPP1 gp7 family putative phage head morphogenesis protein
VPGKVSLTRYPLFAELQYARSLKRLVREFRTLALAEIAAHGPSLIAAANQTYGRTDDITFSAFASRDGFMALLQAIIDRLVGGMTFMLFSTYGDVETFAEEVNVFHKKGWNRQVKQAYGDAVNTGPFTEMGLHTARTNVAAVNILSNEAELPALLRAWAQQNVALIKSLPVSIAAQLQSELTAAFVNGTNMKDLSRIVRDRADVGQSRAELIARDQIGKLTGQLSQYRQRAAGIDSYIWRTMHDERVRPTHRVRDGKEYKWSDGGITPGSEIRCRCVSVPIFPELAMQSEQKEFA